jgi:hypothetical protein
MRGVRGGNVGYPEGRGYRRGGAELAAAQQPSYTPTGAICAFLKQLVLPALASGAAQAPSPASEPFVELVNEGLTFFFMSADESEKLKVFCAHSLIGDKPITIYDSDAISSVPASGLVQWVSGKLDQELPAMPEKKLVIPHEDVLGFFSEATKELDDCEPFTLTDVADMYENAFLNKKFDPKYPLFTEAKKHLHAYRVMRESQERLGALAEKLNTLITEKHESYTEKFPQFYALRRLVVALQERLASLDLCAGEFEGVQINQAIEAEEEAKIATLEAEDAEIKAKEKENKLKVMLKSHQGLSALAEKLNIKMKSLEPFDHVFGKKPKPMNFRALSPLEFNNFKALSQLVVALQNRFESHNRCANESELVKLDKLARSLFNESTVWCEKIPEENSIDERSSENLISFSLFEELQSNLNSLNDGALAHLKQEEQALVEAHENEKSTVEKARVALDKAKELKELIPDFFQDEHYNLEGKAKTLSDADIIGVSGIWPSFSQRFDELTKQLSASTHRVGTLRVPPVPSVQSESEEEEEDERKEAVRPTQSPLYDVSARLAFTRSLCKQLDWMITCLKSKENVYVTQSPLGSQRLSAAEMNSLPKNHKVNFSLPAFIPMHAILGEALEMLRMLAFLNDISSCDRAALVAAAEEDDDEIMDDGQLPPSTKTLSLSNLAPVQEADEALEDEALADEALADEALEDEPKAGQMRLSVGPLPEEPATGHPRALVRLAVKAPLIEKADRQSQIMVWVIDMSGSMHTYVEALNKIYISMAGKLDDNTSIYVLTYSNEATFIGKFSPSEIESKLTTVLAEPGFVGGGTYIESIIAWLDNATNEAILKEIHDAAEKNLFSALLVTDGGNTSSPPTFMDGLAGQGALPELLASRLMQKCGRHCNFAALGVGSGVNYNFIVGFLNSALTSVSRYGENNRISIFSGASADQVFESLALELVESLYPPVSILRFHMLPPSSARLVVKAGKLFERFKPLANGGSNSIIGGSLVSRVFYFINVNRQRVRPQGGISLSRLPKAILSKIESYLPNCLRKEVEVFLSGKNHTREWVCSTSSSGSPSGRRVVAVTGIDAPGMVFSPTTETGVQAGGAAEAAVPATVAQPPSAAFVMLACPNGNPRESDLKALSVCTTDLNESAHHSRTGSGRGSSSYSGAVDALMQRQTRR